MDDRSPPEEGWIHDLREGSFHEDRAMESAGAAPRQLALLMAELARDLYRAGSSEQVVDRVLGACVELVDGCAEAGVSLRRSRDRIETPATTGELARSLDALQDELDEGPYPQTVRAGRSVAVADLATDPRWPRFGPRAAALGARSLMAVRLFTDDEDTIAVLNLYGTRPHAFTAADEDTVAILAAHAAVAIDAARTRVQLQEAVRSRQVIGEAIGILKERYTISSDEAFRRLRRASQDLNVKLHAIARHLSEEADRAAARHSA